MFNRGIFNKVTKTYKQKARRTDNPYETIRFTKDDEGSRTAII